LAAELKQNFGAESTLIPGGGGVFDVSVGGKTIFSKRRWDVSEEGESRCSRRNSVTP
jgi:predicted Rdx family selenoprotein